MAPYPPFLHLGCPGAASRTMRACRSMRAPLLAAAVCAACVSWAAGQEGSLCPPTAANETCVISGVVLQPSTTIALTLNGSLLIANSTITSNGCGNDPQCANGFFNITAGGNVVISNSSIYFPSLVVLANNFSMDNSSLLSADAYGTNRQSQPGAEGVAGTGGGHGGTGSYVISCRPSIPAPSSPGGQGFGFLNLSSPFDFGGSSAGWDIGLLFSSNGGGRIWISTAEQLTVNGIISAQGEDGQLLEKCSCGPGGGAGGSIQLASASIFFGPDAQLTVAGGSSQVSGGGGGGMVAIVAGTSVGASQTNINVTGGATMSNAYHNCPVGGTGLWYSEQLLRRPAFVESCLTALHAPGLSSVLGSLSATHTLLARHLSTCAHASTRDMEAGVGVRVPRSQFLRAPAGHPTRHPRAQEDALLKPLSLEAAVHDAADAVARCLHFRAVNAKAFEQFRSSDVDVPPLQACIRQNLHVFEFVVTPSTHVAASAPPLLPEYAAVGSSTSPSLSCATSVSHGSSSPLTQTTISGLDTANLSTILMTNCAWDLGSLSTLSLYSWNVAENSNVQTRDMSLLLTGSLTMLTLSRMYTASINNVLMITLGGSLTVTQGLLNAGLLTVTCNGSTTIGTQAYLRFAYMARIVAGSLTLSNIISQVDIPPTTTTLVVLVTNATFNPGCSVSAGNVQIEALNTCILNGAVNAVANPPASTCPAAGSGVAPLTPAVTPISCASPSASAAGYALSVVAQNLLLQHSSVLQASTIRMCAANMNVLTSCSISADFLGCGPETGFGPGTSATSTASSGAGHGGVGGTGVLSGVA
ncbi:hypothetical protein EON66_01860, partial [archaeon]